jgi:hypothetical protein
MSKCFIIIIIIINIIIIIIIKSRNMRWTGHAARMENITKTNKILVEISEGKRPPGRPGRRWEDNIRMDHGEIGREVVE